MLIPAQAVNSKIDRIVTFLGRWDGRRLRVTVWQACSNCGRIEPLGNCSNHSFKSGEMVLVCESVPDWVGM